MSDATTRTRPEPRAFLVVLLVALVYGAGANIGSGAVLFLAAGMVVGVLWSALPFLWRARRLRVSMEPTLVCVEGTARVGVTVVVPRGVVGTVGFVATMSADDEFALLRVLGEADDGCPDCDRPVHWAMLPPLGGSALLDVPALVGRGTDQRLTLAVHVTDVLGLVRRRTTLPGPVVTAVAAPGVAAPFRASTHEDDAEDLVAHALTANGAPGAELRQWRPGESIRAVHWAASMRTDDLLIRPRSPETHQRRSLGIEDRTWTRRELDARCRDVTATAERLTAAGVRVEVAAGGAVLPWGPEARRMLAALPPNAERDLS